MWKLQQNDSVSKTVLSIMDSFNLVLSKTICIIQSRTSGDFSFLIILVLDISMSFCWIFPPPLFGKGEPFSICTSQVYTFLNSLHLVTFAELVNWHLYNVDVKILERTGLKGYCVRLCLPHYLKVYFLFYMCHI